MIYFTKKAQIVFSNKYKRLPDYKEGEVLTIGKMGEKAAKKRDDSFGVSMYFLINKPKKVSDNVKMLNQKRDVLLNSVKNLDQMKKNLLSLIQKYGLNMLCTHKIGDQDEILFLTDGDISKYEEMKFKYSAWPCALVSPEKKKEFIQKLKLNRELFDVIKEMNQ